jgi:hypothetical protein
MSGLAIQQEVFAALREASAATGAGVLEATLVRRAAAMPWQAAGAEASFPPMPCVIEGYHEREIDGESIRRGDRKVMLAATGEAPRTGDRLVIGGRRWVAVDVAAEEPGGLPLFFVVQVRAEQ